MNSVIPRCSAKTLSLGLRVTLKLNKIEANRYKSWYCYVYKLEYILRRDVEFVYKPQRMKIIIDESAAFIETVNVCSKQWKIYWQLTCLCRFYVQHQPIWFLFIKFSGHIRYGISCYIVLDLLWMLLRDLSLRLTLLEWMFGRGTS